MRGCRSDDLDGMLAVYNESARAEAGQGRMSREALAAYWRRRDVQAERDVWVVERDGQVLAYGGLRPWHGPEWLQAELVVRPALRGRGLGQALLDRLVGSARRRGALFLCAVAPDEPAESGHFLAGHGFEPYVRRQHMRLSPIVAAQALEVPGIVVRPARPADDAALAEVNNAAYATGERVGRANAAGYRRFIEESGARVWVAEATPTADVVGLCEVRQAEAALGGGVVATGHIGSLAVLPAQQERGIGRRLLAAGVALCREAGWPSVELNVDCDNLAAVHLYESAGFRRVYGFTVYRLSLAPWPAGRQWAAQPPST